MAGSIILLKFAIWQLLLQERQKVFPEYILIHRAVHRAVDQADIGCSLLRNPCPHHNFVRILWPGLRFQCSSHLSVWECPMIIQLYHRFVCPNHVIEFVPEVSSCPLHSFLCFSSSASDSIDYHAMSTPNHFLALMMFAFDTLQLWSSRSFPFG